MAVARVQFGSATALNASSITVTLGSPTTAGNLLVVFVSADGAGSSAPTGVTLTGSSDVFTQDADVSDTNPTALVNLSLWSDPNCAGGLTSVVAAFSGTVGGPLMSVWEVSGAASSSPLAGTPATAAAPANALQASFDSGAAASVVSGCWWAGCVTGIGSGGRAQASPSGAWTAETPLQPGSVTQMLPAYQAGPGAGSPEYAGTFTAPVAGAFWAAIAAAYLPLAGVSVALPAAALALAAPVAAPAFAGAVALPAAQLALAAPVVTPAGSGAATVLLTAPNLALAAPAVSPGGGQPTALPQNVNRSGGVFQENAQPEGSPQGTRYVR